MRLEVGDAGDGQVDVIAPSGDDRVRLDSHVTALFEEIEEGFPHGILQSLSPHRESLDGRVADEGVWILGRITASGAIFVPRPEACAGHPACLADVS
jgi:hypothetical protein